MRTGFAFAAVVAVALGGAAIARYQGDEGHEGHEGHEAHEGHQGQVVVAPALPPPAAPNKHHPAATTSTALREEPRVAIEVPAVQLSRIGLLTAHLETQHVTPSLRTVALVQVDERREAHVHTRVAGFIDEILVSAVGQPVKKGQILYRLYSPELVSTQQEYLAGREQGEIGRRVAAAALERLALWGVSPRDIATLRETGTVQHSLAIESPASGVVVEKAAAQGIYATPDMHLYRIVDLSTVWVVAALYESDISIVKRGDAVDIELPSEPGKVIHATISYIYPEIDAATRTGKARIELSNADGALKPGMYAAVSIAKDLGDVLVAPADAIIDTGTRKIMFVRTSATRFEPRAVLLGPRVGEGFVVASGVAAGDDVVVRAGFLIDAESRLQAALKSGGGPQGHAGHGGG